MNDRSKSIATFFRVFYLKLKSIHLGQVIPYWVVYGQYIIDAPIYKWN